MVTQKVAATTNSIRVERYVNNKPYIPDDEHAISWGRSRDINDLHMDKASSGPARQQHHDKGKQPVT